MVGVLTLLLAAPSASAQSLEASEPGASSAVTTPPAPPPAHPSNNTVQERGFRVQEKLDLNDLYKVLSSCLPRALRDDLGLLVLA